HLCYQSRSGPVEWLEPGTDILLNELAEKGFHSLLVLPISFVSDHVETLYEIDMLYSEMMAEKGVNLVRTPSLNDRPLFINALSNLAEQGLKKAGWLK
ncbi:MAG: ferrochelatase, partial [Deltaproteobacteria bacterium]|nr:ferrochelatase [Deltaproteobacteria bacterium]